MLGPHHHGLQNIYDNFYTNFNFMYITDKFGINCNNFTLCKLQNINALLCTKSKKLCFLEKNRFSSQIVNNQTQIYLNQK